MRKVLDEWDGGITVGGRKISNLRNSDDTLIILANEVEMTTMIEWLSRITKEFRLEVNIGKTKIMVVIGQIIIYTAHIWQVPNFEAIDRFVYLSDSSPTMTIAPQKSSVD
ncbi:uncharacterized protein [Diabrotica undecimpunctata]|uniref:uncharacterized protein n=1 Tax=Diabrotica undecimpunctata TaxID=50387 RepID=UPI003B63EB5F